MNEHIVILNFEDYSNKIVKVKGQNSLFEYEQPTMNNNLISEDSLVRTLNQSKGKDFAVLSAYRHEFTKEENIIRNRKLRAILNKRKLGVHQLVGHWLEAPDGIPYDTADKSSLTDTVERSYLIVKPNSMQLKDFVNLIADCLTIDGKTQDAAILHKSSDDGYYLMDAKMELFSRIGNKLTLGEIGQAYSQHVKKISVPFKFEGKEIASSNSGKMMLERNMIH